LQQKPRLGLDLDGVVYRWQDTAIYLLNTRRGTHVSYEAWDHWDYLKETISKEDWKWLWTTAVTEHGLFRYGSLYRGMRDFLDEIKDKYHIVIITSRRENAVRDTVDWLAYQQLPSTEIHILGSGNKSDVKAECDVYIDDAIHNCQDLIENTKGLVIMPDRPWNHGYTSDEITRFHRTYSVAHMKFILEAYHMQINREGALIGATN